MASRSPSRTTSTSPDLPTTCACPAFAYVPDRSATVVERLEAAGAILIGKTNLDQFATGLNGTRSPYGIPASVFDPDYISGGSSSGSAVVVASGLVSFALGTDTAGSGRIPAAFNNIVGLKPTKGIISTRGVVPACKSSGHRFDLRADRRRCGQGCRDGDRIRQGGLLRADPTRRPSGRRPVERTAQGRGAEYDRCRSSRMRISAALSSGAIDRMAGLGAEITPFDYEPFRQVAAMLYAGPWVAERLAAVGDLAERNPQMRSTRSCAASFSAAKSKSAPSAFESFYRLAELCRAARCRMGADGCHAAADGRHDLQDRGHAGRSRAAQHEPRRLHEFRQPDGPRRARRAGGFPAGRHSRSASRSSARAFSDGKLAIVGDALHRCL